jgi:hypothetical protein
MSISWLLFALVLVATNRWFKHWWKVSQLMHTVAGSLVTIATTLSGITMIARMGFSSEELHFIFGPILTFSVFALSLSGWLSYLSRFSTKSTMRVIKAGKFHRVLGLTLFFVGILTASAGIKLYFERNDKDLEFLSPLALALMVIISLGMETWH